MSICYLGADRQTKYKCTYELNDGITVFVEYDISEEVKTVNGVKTWSTSTRFPSRDVIIADPENHSYFLVKDAYYAGNSFRWGSVDDLQTVSFKSDDYLESDSLNKIIEAASTSLFTGIKVYSQEIARHYGSPSVTLTKTKSSTVIEMKNNSKSIETDIGINNIQKISVGDFWRYNRSEGLHIDISISGYIELRLIKEAAIEECYKYLKELAIYLQMFTPGRFSFDSVQLCVGSSFINYFTRVDEPAIKKNTVVKSVDMDLIGFLEKCYTTIQYRDGKEEIRNIPYIINYKYHNLEDTYLSCFRFIECYYKRTTTLTRNKYIITQALKDYPQNLSSFSTINSANYIEEMVALRNQYVHSGFYLENCSLEIKNSKGKVKRVVTNIDIQWLFERTQILYRVAVDIIFKAMLGFNTYNYK